jgi:hypothetical protein
MRIRSEQIENWDRLDCQLRSAHAVTVALFRDVIETAGVRTVVGRRQPTNHQHTLVAAPRLQARFPHRPDSDVLSDSISLFFIVRNRSGLWIAREAEGRVGGIFLFRKSALRFAKENSGKSGSATMFLSERLELDLHNRGNWVVARVATVLSLVSWYIPLYPPPIPLLEKRRKAGLF